MKKLSLTTRIFISLMAGILVGVLLYAIGHEGGIREAVFIDGIFYIIGNGFIRSLQMLVVPLVFFSLVCGSMSMGDTAKLGRIGVKILLFYIATTAAAITIAIGIGNMIDPGMGLDMGVIERGAVVIPEKASVADIILDIIPQNPVQALAEGNMLQVIFFALIVGVLLVYLGEKASLIAGFCGQCNDLMMVMTSLIMKLAPVGVFCLIARTFSTLGFAAFLPLLKYIAAVLAALAIQCFGLYQVMLKTMTGLSPAQFIRKFLPVMVFAFSTASSNATIPMNIEALSKNIGVSKKVSAFTIPLGATINMDGTAIMQGVAVVFAAQAYGIELTMADYATVILTATLASVGTAGVPSVGLITLSMVFTSVGLPVEAIGLIMGIDRVLDMSRTAVNITGDAVCTTIVAVQEKEFDREVFSREPTRD